MVAGNWEQRRFAVCVAYVPQTPTGSRHIWPSVIPHTHTEREREREPDELIQAITRHYCDWGEVKGPTGHEGS